MTKKIITMAFAILWITTIFGQSLPSPTPLPLNPQVKTGRLHNGLTYYVLHNEEPKERANFYIAQKVGSTLEEADQLGLAHFLEHMAFNGTKHYPGKSMLNYLQGKGLRFGADINAYTAFDETVYNINNVPTNDSNLMDSVLLVLHDWSCDLLLEDQEIDAERGVIQEEWRQRNTADFRFMLKILPDIYEEYQYEQTPIGKMEVVMNFKPETLRAYYKKWYRPDQQGIVVVGDFDPEEMEKKIIEVFSPITMPENAAERIYTPVNNNVKPIYSSFTDPELSSPRTTISFKKDVVPFEYRNTVENYCRESIVNHIVTSFINLRLGDVSRNPDCNFNVAGVSFGNFYVSKTKDAFNVVVIPKPGKTQAAVAEVMAIVVRALKTGITANELEIIKNQILSSYEAAYNERNKISNDAYGSELNRFFIDNAPAPGIELEYQIVKSLLADVSPDFINQCLFPISSDNMVIVTTEPEKEGFRIVAEDVLVKTVNDAINAEYEAFVDEAITESLISKLPKPGKVKSLKETAYGMKEIILSNGVKVYIKPTELAQDQILFTAFRKGGTASLDPADANNIKMLSTVLATAKRGPFDNKTLPKYLAGKQASIGVGPDSYNDIISGSSTVKDLPTLMELIYATFTELNPDKETYGVIAEKKKTDIRNNENNPNTIFGKRRQMVISPDNPLSVPSTPESIDCVDYDAVFAMAKDMLSNAADYTFLFTGNVDEKAIIPLLEQYIATLPTGKPRAKIPMHNFKIARGDIREYWQQPMKSPGTTVYDMYSDYGNVPYNLRNVILIELMAECLTDIYTQTLREEEGGTYGAYAGASISKETGLWSLVYMFQTNKDQQDALIKRAHSELLKLMENGVDPVLFNKVKEAAIKQYEISLNQNNYWHGAMVQYLRGEDNVKNYERTLKDLNADDLNDFMKKLWNGKNRIQIIMEGTEAKS